MPNHFFTTLIQFPATAHGDTSVATISLFNSGSGQIAVSSIAVDDTRFFTSLSSFTINPGQTVNVPLSFVPGTEVGIYSTTVSVYNNSVNNTTRTIQAFGLGYEGFFNVVEPTGLPYTVVVDSLVGPLDSIQAGDEIGIFDGRPRHPDH